MNKKISVGATLSLMLITAATTFCITWIFTWQRYDTSFGNLFTKMQMYSKLSKVDGIVRSKFIGTIDNEKLTDDMIAGYIAGLGDKHSLYLDKASKKAVEDDVNGQSAGLGIIFSQDSTTKQIYVVRVVDGSPAKSAGVQAGDIVTKVNGDDVADLGYEKTINALRGDVGKSAVFSVTRAGKQVDFSIERKSFTSKTVESMVINNDIGFIRIHQFGTNTAEEFRAALDELTNQKKVTSLIFDVRNNPGGTLDSVAKIIDRLVPQGTIVSANYKNGKPKVLFTSDATEVKLPMAVLVNENSASAAELFSCALKDYNKAVLVGVNTYGKGTMQETISLGDGTALDLSIAKFNPPKSPNFDGKGVAPNIIIQMPDKYKEHMYELNEQTDPQLAGAINALASK